MHCVHLELLTRRFLCENVYAPCLNFRVCIFTYSFMRPCMFYCNILLIKDLLLDRF